jgi:hypothetical protein
MDQADVSILNIQLLNCTRPIKILASFLLSHVYCTALLTVVY